MSLPTPPAAHVDYDDDRVIDLIRRGIDQPETADGQEALHPAGVAEDLR